MISFEEIPVLDIREHTISNLSQNQVIISLKNAIQEAPSLSFRDANIAPAIGVNPLTGLNSLIFSPLLGDLVALQV